jgi:hypothetical protein
MVKIVTQDFGDYIVSAILEFDPDFDPSHMVPILCDCCCVHVQSSSTQKYEYLFKCFIITELISCSFCPLSTDSDLILDCLNCLQIKAVEIQNY